MKSTGIVRKVDTLGRVVLPKELRDVLNINHDDALEIFMDDDTIYLKKYEPGCVFCGSLDDAVNFKGKNVCKECKNSID
jgi:transcriptional pleiotropic regulator of transition state genes